MINLDGQFVTIGGQVYRLSKVVAPEASLERKVAITEEECLRMYQDVDLLSLRSGYRGEDVVDCRHTIYYILYNVYRISCLRLAKHFNVDHASILHGARKINGYIDAGDDAGVRAIAITSNVNNRLSLENVKPKRLPRAGDKGTRSSGR